MATGEARGDAVAVRAFRGTRRTSVYQEHVVDARSFRRIVETAERKELPVLSSLDGRGAREVDKHAAHRLADELTQLRRGGELLELDDELVAIAAVASWCARSRERAWLRIG
jgi:hypothetical protein